MTQKEFNGRVKELYAAYGLTPTADTPNAVNIQTPYGPVRVRAEHNGRLKTSAIYSRIDGDIKGFVKETGYEANLFTGKLNSYSTDPDFILNELEEYINNLLYLGASENRKAELNRIYIQRAV